MKKLLVIASVGFLMSCAKTEIVNPTLSSEVGTGNVSGKFRVNLDETNLSSGNIIYESFPSGAPKLQVTYSQSDIDPVIEEPSEEARVSVSSIEKVIIVQVGTDGSYSFDVPASGKGTNINVKPLNFVATRTFNDGSGIEVKDAVFSASSFSLTVTKGGSYPQTIKSYFYSGDAE